MDALLDCLVEWLGARGVTAYLVGGYVRDLLLGRPIYDVDVAVDGDTLSLSRQAADALGGAFYVLDEARQTARVLLPSDDGIKEVDFARLKGGDLEADLSERDFTINAMALSLSDRSAASVIDPQGGQADLRAKRLRAVSPTSISDDPIRILRAVRLTGELGFNIDPDTDRLVRQALPVLGQVSAERIRDEWSRILALPTLDAPLCYMHEAGILWALVSRFGAPVDDPNTRDSLFNKAIAIESALSRLLDHPRDVGPPYDGAIAPYQAQLQAHLGAYVSDRRSRRLLLRFVALLHPLLQEDGARIGACLSGLRFSNAEARRARLLCKAWAAGAVLSGVARGTLHRFYRQAGDAGPDAVLWRLAESLTGADAHLASAESHRAHLAWQAYFDEYETIVAPPRLIDGDALLAHFDLQPGPRLRDLLDDVREAQAEGRISSTEEALRWVERRIANG